jgi:hypothetical protein
MIFAVLEANQQQFLLAGGATNQISCHSSTAHPGFPNNVPPIFYPSSYISQVYIDYGSCIKTLEAASVTT